jgi:hypothetical protein
VKDGHPSGTSKAIAFGQTQRLFAKGQILNKKRNLPKIVEK